MERLIQLKFSKLIFLYFNLIFFSISFVNAQISGTVFRDFNGNGTKDNSASFNEPFVQGITVKAFPATGAAQTTTTNSSGAYSFAGLTLPVRIEFSGFLTGDFPAPVGSGNSSSVQFYNAPSSVANFGVNYPSDYSNPANIKLYTPVYTNGDPLLGGSSGSQRGLISVDHTTAITAPYSTVANSAQIGSSWGIAYHKSAKKLLVASFLKRHYGLGSGGLGQIYSLNTTTNAVTSFLNLSSDYGISVGAVDRSTIPLPGDTAVANYDIDAFGKVGTVGLGGIELSDNDRYLFVANLFDRKIYVFEIGPNATKPTAFTALSLNAVNCTGGQARPWALKFYRGALYVGAVCTAETSESPADLVAKVIKYPFDPVTGIAGIPNEVLSFPLRGTALWGPNEIKGPLTTGYYNGIAPTNDPDFARWQNWATSEADYSYFLNPNAIGGSNSLRYWAQPILSDLEFDVDGSMILGFTDRLGNQMGLRNYEPDAGSNSLKSGVAGGDIYRACFKPSSGQYVLESNGSLNDCGLSSAGGANTHGPGGGEFYFQDGMPYSNNVDHSEGAMGALALIPGYGQVISTQMGITWSSQNNQNWWSGGFNWYSNQDGSWDRAYLVYRSPVPEANSGNPKANFGKANGLGDIEVVTDPAPIEIGNRVWMDTDSDGVQDADEMGLDGVTVKLFQGTTLVSTKTTANGGQYYFNTADGLLPNTAYTIRIEAASIPSGKFVTLKDQPTGGVQDMGDNDASLVGANADITYTTGNAGENNHTLDFGFSAELTCSSTVTAIPGTCNSATNQYTLTGTVTFSNPPSTGTLTVQIAGGGSQVFNAPFTSPQSYSIAGQTSDGVNHTVTATFSADGTCTSNTTYTAPASCSGCPPIQCGSTTVQKN